VGSGGAAGGGGGGGSPSRSKAAAKAAASPVKGGRQSGPMTDELFFELYKQVRQDCQHTYACRLLLCITDSGLVGADSLRHGAMHGSPSGAEPCACKRITASGKAAGLFALPNMHARGLAAAVSC
jgi:hypothetical protein